MLQVPQNSIQLISSQALFVHLILTLEGTERVQENLKDRGGT